MGQSPLTSIGLVTWNSARHLPESLSALSANTEALFELIVVDNASADDSLAQVNAHFPTAHVIRNPANLGFCQAHNQAIRLAQGDYYLPLNPDVVMQPGYLVALVNALEYRPDYGMAVGKLQQSLPNHTPAHLDSTGLFLDRRRRQYLRGHGEIDQGQYDQADEVFGADGAASLYRRTMLEDVQVDDEYFDESFFAHKEDVDLSWRARLLGWRCWYTPQAVALHPRHFRPGRREPIAPAIRVHAVKNRYLLLLKNESRWGWQRDGAQIMWYDLQILVYLCLFERASFQAFGLLRRAWPRAREWRRQIWKRARVDPRQMLAWFR